MRVLFAASECAPFAKAGGLGDVVGALPKALRAHGLDVRVVIPRYGFIPPDRAHRHFAPLGVPMGGGEAWCAVLEGRLPGTDIPVYFLEHDALFGGPRIYEGYGGELHELARSVLLSRGALQLCRYLVFEPDVVHVHDWPTAWLPVMLNTVENRAPFTATATVLTIHNIAHQPRFPPVGLDYAQVGSGVFTPDGLEDHGSLNPLKGGAYHATMVTTVSSRYAREIRTPEGGAGMQHVMNFRGADLVGIRNGIDDEEWDPSRDPHIAARYDAADPAPKAICKLELQKELELEPRPDVPLIGVVSRLNLQKGTDLIVEALDRILALDVQLIVLGSGDLDLSSFLLHRSKWEAGRLAAWIGYNEALAHRIEAGADLFLMPSRFEPCGLTQMYSQRYGTPPIVRATGGLDDTVQAFEPGGGTGFKFEAPTAEAMLRAIEQAVDLYRTEPGEFRALQRRCMKLDQGWTSVARAYVDLYGWAVEKKRSPGPP